MDMVTVGPKYQVVIPKNVRAKIRHLRPGKRVVVMSTDQKTIQIKPVEQTWSDRTYGMMKDAWKETDPIKELEKMRDGWK